MKLRPWLGGLALRASRRQPSRALPCRRGLLHAGERVREGRRRAEGRPRAMESFSRRLVYFVWRIPNEIYETASG
jgi:hypothetical protein